MIQSSNKRNLARPSSPERIEQEKWLFVGYKKFHDNQNPESLGPVPEKADEKVQENAYA